MTLMTMTAERPNRLKGLTFRRRWAVVDGDARGKAAPVTRNIAARNVVAWTPGHAAELVAKVASAADRAAFAELFNYFAPRLRSYCARQGAAPDLANELVQETMLVLWRKAASFDLAKAQVSTWLFTIVRNKRIDRLRRENRPELTADDLAIFANDETSAHDEMSAQQDASRLSVALEALPPEQRTMMVKAFFEDKSHSDIAAETGLPLGTVKSRIRLALSRLKQSIKE
jgi:RNA polymerase sigma factor (sigma-70 family)